jgi:LytS/YehU family sensor histidine kinase
LQPLVENAVKHGAGNTEEICTLRVGVEESSAGVELSVRDSGPGFASTDPADVFGKGTGLTNVRQRLHLLFGTQAELEIHRNGVSLHFPKQLVRSPANLSSYDGHPLPKPALA